jgi:hypothetical protein
VSASALTAPPPAPTGLSDAAARRRAASAPRRRTSSSRSYPLASLTYGVAAPQSARRGALAQQLNAIESLASVDLVCRDETGTLSETRSRVVGLVPATGTDEGDAVPAGTAAGLAVLSSYLFSLNVLDLRVVEARTVATTALILVGLAFIVLHAARGRPRGRVAALCALLLGSDALVLAFPFARAFFALAQPRPEMIAVVLVGSALALGGLSLTGERFRLHRPRRGQGRG